MPNPLRAGMLHPDTLHSKYRMIAVPTVATLLLALAVTLAAPGAAAYQYVEHEMSVILVPGAHIDDVNERWGTTTIVAIPQQRAYLLYVPGDDDLEELAETMAQDPDIQSAQPNYVQETPEAVRQMVIGAVGGSWDDYEDQEITVRIGLDAAHGVTMGAGTVVAILDTGVDPDHDVFADRISPDAYDFLDMDDEPWEEANGLDDDEDGLTDEGFGHGSMVAGIIALVAPEATLLPIRIIDDEGRTDAFLISQGIKHAVEHGADVINMSFGVPLGVDIVAHFTNFANQLGVIHVGAAGNENREFPPYYPAAFSQVAMVTALDSMDIKADFADYTSKVLVSAPGTGVRSAYPGNDWGIGSGCSFATPFVAGEAALLKSLAADLTWQDAQSLIAFGVENIYHIPENAPYEGKLGTGRIYIPRALGGLVAGVESDLSRPGLCVSPSPVVGAAAFRMPWDSDHGTLEILDTTGRIVRSLSWMGSFCFWDGRGENGLPVPSGVYFGRAVAGSTEHTAVQRFCVIH